MEFKEREYFEQELSGELMLLKKHYSILEENQPFGLRWFIPEFYRQRALLSQVALAILSISLIGLAIPIFFQLVVDKVLVHESYNTLTVLGFGVMVMLLFNAALEYLENYFLLFATNRIDIRLATRTFAKLLSLPVDFYERISSGVLIKHMQQTEKIRSFLSGSLFFSVLELLSLVVFLPFLLIYSVKLTIVVLAFTLMMALVIAALISRSRCDSKSSTSRKASGRECSWKRSTASALSNPSRLSPASRGNGTTRRLMRSRATSASRKSP